MVAWGTNASGQLNVPALPAGLAYVGLAVGAAHNLACRSDGSVVAWGYNGNGECNVPALPQGLTYLQVAAGNFHTGAVRSDGALLCWGLNSFGQCNVLPLPAGMRYVEVDAGGNSTIARYEPICPAPTVYCTPGTSASGCNVTIASTGAASATASSGFVLSSSSVDGQRTGLFFYGAAQPGYVPVAWGTGGSFMCVKSPTQRTPAQNSGGTADTCSGSYALDWNDYMAANPGSLGNPRVAGTTFEAQVWMRDPASTKTTVMSDGLRFTACP